MKQVILIIIVLFFAKISFGQAWLKNLPKTKNSKDLTLFDYQRAFNDYWNNYNVKNGKFLKNGELVKAPGWKIFKRWVYYMESRVNNTTGEFPTISTRQIIQKFKSANSGLKSTKASWLNLGTNSSSGGYAGIGRINCISFHPTDANTFWVGAPSGGIWKTTNGGTSWSVQIDDFDNSAIGASAIAVSPNFESDNTLYIATGDRDGGSSWTLGGNGSNDNNSVGVLKSTDGGNSWTATGLTELVSNKRTINALLIDPNNSSILYAGLYDGVYKTINGGTDWTKVYSSSVKIIDMELNPGTPSTIYACTEDYWGTPVIVSSHNSGTDWTTATIDVAFTTQERRIELAVGGSGANTDYVYAVVANRDGGITGIYKSTDSGTNYEQTFDGSTKSIFGYYSDGSGDNTGQGSYDIALAVKPNDVNTLFVGGINTWKSTDGGVNWLNNNMWTSQTDYNTSSSPVVHADKHCLKYQDNTTLYEGNDGGIYRTTAGGTSWTDLSNGLVISQIYRIGVSALTEGTIINGLQDNGSKLLTGASWFDVSGGDGMECIIDYTNDDIQYATYQRGEITRTTDGWTGSSTAINENIGDGTLQGAWVTPYIIDPTNHNILYVGYADVWKTEDQGDSFTKISSINSSGNLRSMAIAASDNQTLYVADQETIWYSTDGGASWTDITGSLPIGTNNITFISVHANDPQTVWITMGGYNSSKVFKSTDGGTNWSDFSTGLPSIPVFTIVQDKVITNNDILYVGTDVGVYYKLDNDNWLPFNTNLPNVMVTELEIYYAANHDNSKLRAATYGRGLWESDIVSSTQDTSVFSECFDGTTMPTGWAKEILNDEGVNGTPDIDFISISVNPDVFSAQKCSNFTRFNSFSCDASDKIRLKMTSAITATDLDSIQLNFDWTQDDQYPASNDTIFVQYSLDGANWNNMDTVTRYNSSGDAWKSRLVSLPDESENKTNLYLAFLFISAFGNDMHLDNIVVTQILPSAPFVSSANTSTDGSEIEIVFNKDMNDPTGKHAEFSVNNGATITPNAVSLKTGSTNTFILHLPASLSFGETVTVSYAEGTITSTDNGVLASFTNNSVTNNVIEAPKFSSASTNTDGSEIEITFTKAMIDPTGKHTEFSVNNGIIINPDLASLKTGDANTIVLHLPSSILHTETVTVSYTKGSIESSDLGILAGFADSSVTNNVEIPQAIKTIENYKGLNIYPNPNSGQFMVNFKDKLDGKTIIKLYNIQGKLIFSKEFNGIKSNFDLAINIQNQSKGLYSLIVENNKLRYQKSVVIQ